MIIKMVIFILLAYIIGCGVTFDILSLLEERNRVEYTKQDKIKLILGSWYSAIILNNILK
jgi:hypothetical protein